MRAELPPVALPTLFERQVALHPANIALISGGSSLSYSDLNLRANRLAHLLLRRGIGPEDLVAIALPRSSSMIISILAVLKAGAAYLPIDPSYPAERIAFLLEDAAPAAVITEGTIAARLPASAPVLVLDRVEVAAHATAEQPERNPTDPDRKTLTTLFDSAYVIYTSGSTGRPKGVVITHAGLANLSATQTRRFAITPDARVWQSPHPASMLR